MLALALAREVPLARYPPQFHAVVIGAPSQFDIRLPEKLVFFEWLVVDVMLPAIPLSRNGADVRVLQLQTPRHFKSAIKVIVLLVELVGVSALHRLFTF